MNPLLRSHQELPSTDYLCELPQLAALVLRQANLRVAGQGLGIQHPELGLLHLRQDPPDPDDLLAQLLIDRCRELSELVTNYRPVLHPDRHLRCPFDDTSPF